MMKQTPLTPRGRGGGDPTRLTASGRTTESPRGSRARGRVHRLRRYAPRPWRRTAPRTTMRNRPVPGRSHGRIRSVSAFAPALEVLTARAPADRWGPSARATKGLGAAPAPREPPPPVRGACAPGAQARHRIPGTESDPCRSRRHRSPRVGIRDHSGGNDGCDSATFSIPGGPAVWGGGSARHQRACARSKRARQSRPRASRCRPAVPGSPTRAPRRREAGCCRRAAEPRPSARPRPAASRLTSAPPPGSPGGQASLRVARTARRSVAHSARRSQACRQAAPDRSQEPTRHCSTRTLGWTRAAHPEPARP
jgi:hypothetical protein